MWNHSVQLERVEWNGCYSCHDKVRWSALLRWKADAQDSCLFTLNFFWLMDQEFWFKSGFISWTEEICLKKVGVVQFMCGTLLWCNNGDKIGVLKLGGRHSHGIAVGGWCQCGRAMAPQRQFLSLAGPPSCWVTQVRRRWLYEKIQYVFFPLSLQLLCASRPSWKFIQLEYHFGDFEVILFWNILAPKRTKRPKLSPILLLTVLRRSYGVSLLSNFTYLLSNTCNGLHWFWWCKFGPIWIIFFKI